MNNDDYRSLQPSSRPVERSELPAGPTKNLRDAIYHLYADAGCPLLDKLADVITDDDSLPGSPRKDLIGRIVAGAGLASQQDTVTVAVALARAAGHDDTFITGDKIRQLWITAVSAPAPAAPARIGIPISECNAIDLEVHPAITVPGQASSMPTLPAYVMRVHDARLDQVAAQAVAGSSQMVTLVGGSSTGKTRACWELIQRLEQMEPGRWRVWHPYDPTRPEAAAAALEQVGPDTIIWLNEAQFYLAPSDPRLGEQIAAGLRTLRNTPGRGPGLILATLWPQHWTTLTVPPGAKQPDPHAQARELLTGTDIAVADTFSTTDLTRLRQAADPRLRHAVEHADTARVTQYLAGAPELENRYRHAPPAARAIIDVAIDARRLGYPPAIPHQLLAKAAPGYLDDHDWDTLDDDWLEQALAYTARPCNGARGPLTRIRPRASDGPSGLPVYRLADYLEQTSRITRAGIYPPNTFWDTVAHTTTDPNTLHALADQARSRSRYPRAAYLYREAADHGDTDALLQLAQLRTLAGDLPGATALYREAADHGNTDALVQLADVREQAGDLEGATAAAREAADHGNTVALRLLAQLREQAGDLPGATALYREAADHGDTDALLQLAQLRTQASDLPGATALYREAADHGNTEALLRLARLREQTGDLEGATAFYQEAADHGKTDALVQLARLREQTGDWPGATAAAREAADHGNTVALWRLAELREQAGDLPGATVLYRQAADHGDRFALLQLAQLWAAGDAVEADRILRFGLKDSGDPAVSLD